MSVPESFSTGTFRCVGDSKKREREWQRQCQQRLQHPELLGGLRRQPRQHRNPATAKKAASALSGLALLSAVLNTALAVTKIAADVAAQI